jgi:hypothetical protein
MILFTSFSDRCDDINEQYGGGLGNQNTNNYNQTIGEFARHPPEETTDEDWWYKSHSQEREPLFNN